MTENSLVPANGGEFLLYVTEDGKTRTDVRTDRETVWLTLAQMADLLQVDKSGISRHLKNIYETGELRREATVAEFATVRLCTKEVSRAPRARGNHDRIQ